MNRARFSDIDFEKTPFVVIWEVTQACALACRHCRAEAIDQRDREELSLKEGKDLVDQVADMGTPIIVFSGGDPLQRDDLEPLIRHAKQRGLRAATIPAATKCSSSATKTRAGASGRACSSAP